MLTVDNLKFAVGSHKILNGVSCNISAGEMVGVIGPNGCGKTTLFNCISGFNTSVSGSIVFDEQDIVGLSAYERSKKGIGRVFQNFGIFRELSLIDNIVVALENRANGKRGFFPWSKITKKYRVQALEILHELNLGSLANERAERLSGGQMRLLEIARTLAFESKLLLLDEPTAGVSPKMKNEVAAQISKLKELNKTVLIIEHDLSFIEKFCKRVLVLDQGQIVLDGTPSVVRADPRLQEIYFGS